MIKGPAVRFKGKVQQSSGRLHFYMQGIKAVLCHRLGSLAGPLTCRVKRHVDVKSLCITAEVGCGPTNPYCRSRTAKERKQRKKGLMKTVIPMTCCHKADAKCIRARLAKWLKIGGRPSLTNPKNWGLLATGEALAV